jgi:hypothetical protein
MFKLFNVRLLIAVAMMAWVGMAQAGDVVGARIFKIVISASDAAFVYVDKPNPNVPACGVPNTTSTTSRYVINLTKAGGKAQFAFATVAFLGGKLIDIVGMNNCNVWGDTESMELIVASS